MRNTTLKIRSRHGEGYLLFAVLFTPFIIALMSLALDGLGLAVTYRRAVGLATVEAGRGGLNPVKRRMLLDLGADAIVPHYDPAGELAAWLFDGAGGE